MNSTKRVAFLLVLLSFFSMTHAACVSVDTGMMIERIGNLRILVKSSEKSIAILDIKEKRISTLTKKEQKNWQDNILLPKTIKSYRFFSNKICNSGAESIISINGRDWQIGKITKFTN